MCQKTYIAIILDKSRSMAVSRESTIKGFNDQVAIIRKDSLQSGMETYVSFYTFNHHVEPKYKCLSVNFLEDLTEKDYECNGDTAMYDCVGQAITDLKNETDVNNPDNSYLVVVVSDGQERCSKNFTCHSLAKLIKECQDTDQWTFSYLGANQDLSKVAESLNINKGSVANYKADSLGGAAAWASQNKQMGNYLKCRAHGVSSLKNFHSDNGEIADYSKVDYNSVVLKKVAEALRIKALWRNMD